MPERSGEDNDLQAIQEGQQERHAQEEEAWQERAAAVGAEQQVEEDAQPQKEEVAGIFDLSTFKLPQKVVDELCDDAVDHKVSEICGFMALVVIDNATVKWTVLKMTNEATDNLEFAMSPEETIERFERYGERIVGVYHSHPQGSHRPSQTDVDYAPIGLRYWIVTQDQVIEWDMCNSAKPSKISTQTRTT